MGKCSQLNRKLVNWIINLRKSQQCRPPHKEIEKMKKKLGHTEDDLERFQILLVVPKKSREDGVKKKFGDIMANIFPDVQKDKLIR